MKKIVIWGTGNRSCDLLTKDMFAGNEIVCVVDTYKKNDVFMGYPVIYPEELQSKSYDWLIIPLADPQEVYEQCVSLNISDEKIIILDNCIMNGYKYHEQDIEGIKEDMPNLYKIMAEYEAIHKQCMPVRRCLLDIHETYNNKIYDSFNNIEYTRFRTMELASREVRDIEGEWSVAELGVWQGGVSRFISLMFPERSIYMFDTFESFDEKEVEKEIKDGRCDQSIVEIFKDTSVERVLNIMPDKSKCIIRKGLFPSTAEGLEDNKYGFVSLDVDLEESTYAGLEYFVPRMIEGGYIFLHDYNHVSLKGVKKAVNDYERDRGIRLKKVPLCDSDGTLIITF